MKESIRNELEEYIRDRWGLIFLGTPTVISIPTLLVILSNFQGRPYLIWVMSYVLVIYWLLSNSLYVIAARKSIPALALPGQPQVEKRAPRYPRLRPYGIAGVVLSIILVPISIQVHPFRDPVDIFFYGTATPIPTQTWTPTLTFTPTITPSPKPLSASLYYMIVYDTSAKMKETFHGEEKWKVALNLAIEIINGLNANAQYSLVAVGGYNSSNNVAVSGDADPCQSPSALALPFSTQNTVYSYMVNLQPGGGGSFYHAYTLAKNQLENLPADTIRTLIYITGSSDSCDSEDEWTAIKNLMSLPDSTFGIYSQIIILDDDGIKSRTLAEQFNSLNNENVQAAAPVSLSELQGGGVTLVQIVNNVNTYVTNIYNTLITETPTLTPTSTFTPRPGETITAQPTKTLAFTATSSKTSTPSMTPSLTPFVCPGFAHPYLGGPGYGGSVYISAPGDCVIGFEPETAIGSGGSYSDLPVGTIVWELVYAPDGLYYPQSPNACAGGPPPNQGGGSWGVNTYLGKAGQPAKWYELVAVVTDQAASDYLSNWLVNGCGTFPGIDPGTLSQMNITEKSSVRVQTR